MAVRASRKNLLRGQVKQRREGEIQVNLEYSKEARSLEETKASEIKEEGDHRPEQSSAFHPRHNCS